MAYYELDPEYMVCVHYDLGSRNVLVGAIPGVGLGNGYISRFRSEGNIVRAGFNYKFGGF